MAWIRSVAAALRRFFGFNDPEAESRALPTDLGHGAPPAALTDRRRRRRSGELDPNTFLSVSAGLGRRDGDARMHVFSLSDFRKAAGDKWGKLAGLVEVASSQIIRRNIDPAHDLYTRLDSDIACLIMPGKDRKAAHAMVTNIAKEMTSHLFGAGLVAGRRPQVVTANLAVTDMFTADGTPKIAAIQAALGQAAAMVPPEIAAEGGLGAAHRASLASLLLADEAAHLADTTRQGFAISGGNPGASIEEPGWVEMGTPRSGRPMEVLQAEGRVRAEERVMQAEMTRIGRPMEVMRVDARVKAEERVMQAEARSPKAAEQVMQASRSASAWLETQIEETAIASAGGAGHMGAESQLTLVWTPTWVTSARSIGAFHARVIREDKGGPPLEGAAAYASASPIEILTLDRFVATQAAAELKSLFYGRTRTGLIVPIHWMSLAPRWREFIRMPLETCPPQALRKLLKIEVFGLNPSMPPQILRSLVEPLEKLGCDVIARLPLSAAGMVADLKAVRAIGADLTELAEDERTGDDTLLERLMAFRDTARGAGIASYVWSVRRRPLIASIARANFSLINGPGIMCDVGRPVPTRPH